MTNALVIVDVQNGFINNFTRSIPKKIVKVANMDFDNIIFLKFRNRVSSNFNKELRWKEMFLSPATDITPELRELAKRSAVFTKTSYSAFRSEKFVSYIKEKNIGDLYICGLDTNACVLATAMEAFERGYRVRVLEDLCASPDGRKAHLDAVSIMKKNLGTVLNSSDALRNGIRASR